MIFFVLKKRTMGKHNEEDRHHFENFNAYYVGWAILILVLLWLLIWAGWTYIDSGSKHGMHGGAYVMDRSMSPGGRHHGEW